MALFFTQHPSVFKGPLIAGLSLLTGPFLTSVCGGSNEMTNTTREHDGQQETEHVLTYVCPDCSMEFPVSNAVRHAISAAGCPLCTTRISNDAFEISDAL